MRIPTSLKLSFFVPLVTLALARSGVGPLAQHTGFLPKETLSHTRSRLLEALPPEEREALRMQLDTLQHAHDPDETMDDEALLLYAISFYARKAEQARSFVQAQHFHALAQQLMTHLSTPKATRVAQRRLERARAGRISPCNFTSAGKSPLLLTLEATP